MSSIEEFQSIEISKYISNKKTNGALCSLFSLEDFSVNGSNMWLIDLL